MRAPLLFSLLLTAGFIGCAGSEDEKEGCLPTEEVSLASEIPFGNNVVNFSAGSTRRWQWNVASGPACTDQHVPVTGGARVAPATGSCPPGGASVVIEAIGGPTQPYTDHPSPRSSGEDQEFSGSVQVGMGQFTTPNPVAASIDIVLPGTGDASEDLRCAMERIKSVSLDISYRPHDPNAEAS